MCSRSFWKDGWRARSSRSWRGSSICWDWRPPTSSRSIATFEQPVETKGWLPDRLEPWFPPNAQKLTKQTFDCTSEPEIRDAIAALGVTQFAVAGGETDVCVLQSVLGVLGMGYEVFLLEDALFSEEPNTVRRCGAWNRPA